MTDVSSNELFKMAIEKVFVSLKGLSEAKEMIQESRKRAEKDAEEIRVEAQREQSGPGRGQGLGLEAAADPVQDADRQRTGVGVGAAGVHEAQQDDAVLVQLVERYRASGVV